MTQEERLSRYQQFKDFQKVIHLMRGAQFLGNPIGLKKLCSMFQLRSGNSRK
jgi:hypothetical protein